jgi:hypothetical protein
MDNWQYFYKIDYERKHNVTTNMLYSPMINQTGDTMCMIWDVSDPYQIESTKLTSELVDFFFEREINHLKIMQKFSWAPRLLSIDSDRIYIEFNKETLNHILLDPNRNLDIECPDWREQIFNILKDIINAGYYKMALYPHCFFLKDGIIKTFDFYSCVGIEERYIERKIIENIIGEDSADRFNIATEGNLIDFKKFFEITMTKYLGKTWGKDNPFPEFYKQLFSNVCV